MITCTNCDGSGIVGQGPEPWKQEGHKSTCVLCSGTGTVNAEEDVTVIERPVDKPEAEKPHGILNRIFGHRS